MAYLRRLVRHLPYVHCTTLSQNQADRNTRIKEQVVLVIASERINFSDFLVGEDGALCLVAPVKRP